jgi:uncharacterized membrane protein
MKRTASLEALITTLILFTVAGIQYSADQQKKVTLFARGADDMKNQSALARDMATYRELDRDEAALGWVGIAAAGFLASSFVFSRTDLAHSFRLAVGHHSITSIPPGRSKNRPA